MSKMAALQAAGVDNSQFRGDMKTMMMSTTEFSTLCHTALKIPGDHVT